MQVGGRDGGSSSGGSEDRAPFSPPPAPTTFVPRPAIAGAVVDYLRDSLGPETASGPVVGLLGSSGYGKTTLARWLAHERRIQDLFPDGVLWIYLGDVRSPLQLLNVVNNVIGFVGGAAPADSDGIIDATKQLAELLDGSRSLLVLDRAMKAADVEPFLAGGRRCGRLITSTQSHAIPEAARSIEVSVMEDGEAAALLTYSLPPGARAQLDVLLRMASGWALLLKVLNGVVRQAMHAQGSLTDALALVNQRLAEHPLSPATEVSIGPTSELGLRDLEQRGDTWLNSFLELAMFPEGIEIPIAALQRCWSALGLNEDAGTVASVFSEVPLLEHFDSARSTLRLHPVIREWLRQKQQARLPEMNMRLVDTYRASLSGEGWWALPAGADTEYLWRNLAYHLYEAGLDNELITTVTDMRYLAERCRRFGAAAADDDLHYAHLCNPAHPLVIAAEGLLRAVATKIMGLRRWTDIAATLAVRMQASDKLAGAVDSLAAGAESPRLWPRWAAVGVEATTPIGHHEGTAINSVGCDTVARRAATGGADGTIRIWDTDKSAEPIVRVEGHRAAVNSVSFDHAGKCLASGGADWLVKVWSIGESSATFVTELDGHGAEVNSVSLDATGKRVVSAGADHTARAWELQSDRWVHLSTFYGHTAFVNSVSLSGPGLRAVSGCAEGTVRIWDPATGRQLGPTVGHTHAVNSVSFDQPGERIVSGGADGYIRVWDATSMDLLQEWVGHEGQHVDAVRFDRNGTRIVSGGADDTTRVWDARTGREIASTTYSAGVRAVACDDLGTRIVSACPDGQLWLFSPGSYPTLQSDRPETVRCVATDDGSRRVASGGRDGTVLIKDAHTAVDIRSLKGHGPWVNSVAWDTQSERLASAGADGTVHIWDVSGEGRPLVMSGHGYGGEPSDQFVNSVAFDPDGKRVVSAGADGTVRIWDASSGAPLGLLGGHRVRAEIPRAREVNAAAFDPAGKRVVSAGADGTVRIWDVGALREILVMHGHDGRYVNSAQFDPSGDFVVSGGYDGRTLVWNAGTGQLLYRLGEGSAVASAAFVGDWHHVVCGRANGMMELWEVDTEQLRAQLRLDGSVFACECGSPRTVAVGTGLGLYMLELVLV